MNAKSIRRQLLVTTLAAVLPIVVLASAILFLAVRRSVWLEFDLELDAKAHDIADLLEYDDEGYEFELGEPLMGTPGRATLIRLWVDDGELLAGAEILGQLQRPRVERLGETRFDVLELDGGQLRVAVLHFQPEIDEEDAHLDVPPPPPATLFVARETATTNAMLQRVAAWFVGLGLLTLGAAALAAAWAVERGLRPVNAFAATLEGIDDRALGTRIDPRGLPREIRPIVDRTNGLLDRLERAFGRERQMAADIAHELRNPLSVLRTNLELGLRRERSPSEYQATLADALDTVRELGGLVGNLLTLARLDGSGMEARSHEVALRELVDRCWRSHAELANQRTVVYRCEIDPDLRIEADRDKLDIIVGNLLANAAQYTEIGGWIRVTSEPESGLILAVVDSGPPLSPEARERIFERFWRGDHARSDAGVHCGIGLALVRSLAEVLGWTVAAENHDDGSVAFVVKRAEVRSAAC